MLTGPRLFWRCDAWRKLGTGSLQRARIAGEHFDGVRGRKRAKWIRELCVPIGEGDRHRGIPNVSALRVLCAHDAIDRILTGRSDFEGDVDMVGADYVPGEQSRLHGSFAQHEGHVHEDESEHDDHRCDRDDQPPARPADPVPSLQVIGKFAQVHRCAHVTQPS